MSTAIVAILKKFRRVISFILHPPQAIPVFLISNWISYTQHSISLRYYQDIHSDIRRIFMAYYRRIRDMREDHDLTQRQLAAILKMPQSQYNRYEQGLRDIPTVTLIQLADLYHTSTDYLLGRIENPEFPKT
jgi:hypothetical protein